MSDADYLAAMAEMGRQCRLSQRQIARDAGLAVLSGWTIYVTSGGRTEAIVSLPEDLSALLPGAPPPGK